jgi:hypothetical protein
MLRGDVLNLRVPVRVLTQLLGLLVVVVVVLLLLLVYQILFRSVVG